MTGQLDEIRYTTTLGTWSLTRAQPGVELAAVVHEYWEVKGRLSPFREAVLPNGYVELMFNLGPVHRVLEGAGTGVWEHSWFSGLQEKSIFIESLEGTHLVAARLHPLGAARIFGFAVPRAANSIVELERLVGPHSQDLRTVLRAADGPASRFAILENYLRERLSSSLAIPAFVTEATARLEQAHGRIRVASLHEDLAVSRKHLAVSFNRYVGLSAKAYARVRRFVSALDRLRSATEVEWSRIAVEAGYSDQSHLVRDFRRVGAATPTEYLRRFAPDGDALLESAR